jgi:hypothetical protein
LKTTTLHHCKDTNKAKNLTDISFATARYLKYFLGFFLSPKKTLNIQAVYSENWDKN